MADAGVDARVEIDAMPPDLRHLLLTEVCLAGSNREFIEIFNPTDEAVDLSRYYLSDHRDYALLPAVYSRGPLPEITEFDFLVKFPDGARIEPDQVMVVAMRYADFQGSFVRSPDFGLIDAPAAAAMVVPDARLMSAEPQLSNDGEGIVLFYWDGQSDLVRDVDMVMPGDVPLPLNMLRPKTMVFVDGPDEDDVASNYLPDIFTIGMIGTPAASGFSHKRIAVEGRYEVHDGRGNGLYGDDETSEQITRTWDRPQNYTAPTPGSVPAELRAK